MNESDIDVNVLVMRETDGCKQMRTEWKRKVPNENQTINSMIH